MSEFRGTGEWRDHMRETWQEDRLKMNTINPVNRRINDWTEHDTRMFAGRDLCIKCVECEQYIVHNPGDFRDDFRAYLEREMEKYGDNIFWYRNLMQKWYLIGYFCSIDCE